MVEVFVVDSAWSTLFKCGCCLLDISNDYYYDLYDYNLLIVTIDGNVIIFIIITVLRLFLFMYFRLQTSYVHFLLAMLNSHR